MERLESDSHDPGRGAGGMLIPCDTPVAISSGPGPSLCLVEHVLQSPHSSALRLDTSSIPDYNTTFEDEARRVRQGCRRSFGVAEELRSPIQNVGILVEDFPPNQSPSKPDCNGKLLLGIMACQRSKRSIFNVSMGSRPHRGL